MVTQEPEGSTSDAPASGPRRRSGLFHRPSSRLGWAATAAMAGAIALVIVVNATAEQGSAEDTDRSWIVFVAMVGCLLAGWVMGLVAVIRRHERSLLVLVPTGLLSLAVANELVQGIVQLVGAGG